MPVRGAKRRNNKGYEKKTGRSLRHRWWKRFVHNETSDWKLSLDSWESVCWRYYKNCLWNVLWSNCIKRQTKIIIIQDILSVYHRAASVWKIKFIKIIFTNWKFKFYLKDSSPRQNYNIRLVNAIQEINYCLFRVWYRTYKYTVLPECWSFKLYSSWYKWKPRGFKGLNSTFWTHVYLILPQDCILRSFYTPVFKLKRTAMC